MLAALAWYCRRVLRLEALLGSVTVKRKRNPANPVRRRSSAFRDPKICLNLLLLDWLGVRRLSAIPRTLTGRDDLAEPFGLRRFCDHTTAHNFLNGFHRTHLAQLDRVNARLLERHGMAPGLHAPILDMDGARRPVRHVSPARQGEYRWLVAFCAGEAVAQCLEYGPVPWQGLVENALKGARDAMGRKPRLLRLPGIAISSDLLTYLARHRQDFLGATTWRWARAQCRNGAASVPWEQVDRHTQVRDLGPDRDGFGALRTLLVEELPEESGDPRERWAIVTSLLDPPSPVLVSLAASRTRLAGFFGHPAWPLRDGKPPSSDPRGFAAYLRLAAMAANVLVLFARHLGDEWDPARLRAALQVTPPTRRGPTSSAAEEILKALRPLVTRGRM